MSQPGRGGTPRRVRVTSPRQAAHRQGPVRARSAELAEETGIGDVYVASLMRAQIKLSLALLLGLAVVAVGLPALLLGVPEIHAVRIGPVPVSWLLLGVLIYPFALTVVFSYVRAAERVEREFVDLLHRP